MNSTSTNNLNATSNTTTVEERIIYSEFLERDVIIDVYLTSPMIRTGEIKLLIINDGQDLRKINFSSVLNEVDASCGIEPLMCIGIHCGADRINEYGTIYRTDYMGRGSKAGVYSKFILNELLPFLMSQFKITTFREKAFAGFSLGALSAIDLVWNYPDEFKKAGAFSAALWWRRHGYEDEKYNPEKDRIMHLQVQKGRFQPGLKFFLSVDG